MSAEAVGLPGGLTRGILAVAPIFCNPEIMIISAGANKKRDPRDSQGEPVVVRMHAIEATRELCDDLDCLIDLAKQRRAVVRAILLVERACAHLHAYLDEIHEKVEFRTLEVIALVPSLLQVPALPSLNHVAPACNWSLSPKW